MARGRAGVVHEVERRVAATADGGARPLADDDLDGVAGLELRPADARARAVVVLLDGEGDAARLAMHARAEDLGEVALGRDRLEELLLRARRDHDLARVLDELRDAVVGVHADGAQPVELAIGDVGRRPSSGTPLRRARIVAIGASQRSSSPASGAAGAGRLAGAAARARARRGTSRRPGRARARGGARRARAADPSDRSRPRRARARARPTPRADSVPSARVAR